MQLETFRLSVDVMPNFSDPGNGNDYIDHCFQRLLHLQLGNVIELNDIVHLSANCYRVQIPKIYWSDGQSIHAKDFERNIKRFKFLPFGLDEFIVKGDHVIEIKFLLGNKTILLNVLKQLVFSPYQEGLYSGIFSRKLNETLVPNRFHIFWENNNAFNLLPVFVRNVKEEERKFHEDQIDSTCFASFGSQFHHKETSFICELPLTMVLNGKNQKLALNLKQLPPSVIKSESFYRGIEHKKGFKEVQLKHPAKLLYSDYTPNKDVATMIAESCSGKLKLKCMDYDDFRGLELKDYDLRLSIFVTTPYLKALFYAPLWAKLKKDKKVESGKLFFGSFFGDKEKLKSLDLFVQQHGRTTVIGQMQSILAIKSKWVKRFESLHREVNFAHMKLTQL